MATDQAVSDELKSVILQLMQADCLRDFNLGGGTNLAIRHNHRVSTDIDLFSQGVVGVERLREISSYFRSNFKDDLLGLMEENFGDVDRSPIWDYIWMFRRLHCYHCYCCYRIC